MTESKTSKEQLRWQCRRGMLELDMMLSNFIDREYDGLSDIEQSNFVELLSTSDADLFVWLTDQKEPPNVAFKSLVERIRLCRP